MSTELQFIFRREAMEKLLAANPDFIVIKSSLEAATLEDGRKAGILVVRAEAVHQGKSVPLLSVDGCPRPPCSVDDQR